MFIEKVERGSHKASKYYQLNTELGWKAPTRNILLRRGAEYEYENNDEMRTKKE